MGIRDKPAAPASPWQNGFAERLIGSIRRECVDHIIVLGEMYLRRVLKSYADYYNCVRTHRSLNKDAPVSRPVQRTVGSVHAPFWADFTTTTPELRCQSACKFDPSSASNFDPLARRGLAVALVSSELAGIAEARRARVA